jgi:hypothetical protein
MSQQAEGQDAPSGSLAGVMRVIAAAVVLVLAIVGVLVVFDVTSLDRAGEVTGKVLLVALIVGVASAAVALLMRRPGRR